MFSKIQMRKEIYVDVSELETNLPRYFICSLGNGKAQVKIVVIINNINMKIKNKE